MKNRIITVLLLASAFLCGHAWNSRAAETLDPQDVMTALSDPSIRAQFADAMNGAFEDSNFPIHIPSIRVDHFRCGDTDYFVDSPAETSIPEGALTDSEQTDAIHSLHDVMRAGRLASK